MVQRTRIFPNIWRVLCKAAGSPLVSFQLLLIIRPSLSQARLPFPVRGG
jgi:hypothetical protein